MLAQACCVGALGPTDGSACADWTGCVNSGPTDHHQRVVHRSAACPWQARRLAETSSCTLSCSVCTDSAQQQELLLAAGASPGRTVCALPPPAPYPTLMPNDCTATVRLSCSLTKPVHGPHRGLCSVPREPWAEQDRPCCAHAEGIGVQACPVRQDRLVRSSQGTGHQHQPYLEAHADATSRTQTGQACCGHRTNTYV